MGCLVLWGTGVMVEVMVAREEGWDGRGGSVDDDDEHGGGDSPAS
jgi:hypothetical protein